MFILKSASNTFNQNEIELENKIMKGDIYNAFYSRSRGNAELLACFTRQSGCLAQTLPLFLTIKVIDILFSFIFMPWLLFVIENFSFSCTQQKFTQY